MRILILHGIENIEIARRTSINHAFFLIKYRPEHEYVVQSVCDPVPVSVRDGDFDLILIDTTFLCWRWAKPRSEGFDRVLDRFAFVARSEAVKVALPQDEYDHSELLDDWLADWKVDLVGSVCFDHCDVLYPRTSAMASIFESLTGFVDDADLAMARVMDRPLTGRSVDVGYRARHLSVQFGRLGRLKSDVARAFQTAAAGRGLHLDISTREEDAITGDRWLAFLADCKFTLGCESGSSLLDPQGEIAAAIRSYVAVNPGAPFEDIEAACFPGQDGRRRFAAISPRLFESAIANSCQILVTGRYLDRLRPFEHYLPVSEDLSDIEAVFEHLTNDAANADRVRACRKALLEDPALTYRGFADDLLQRARSVARETRGRNLPIEGSRAVETDPERLHADALRRVAESRPSFASTFVSVARSGPARSPRKSACLLSLSRIPDDPRVRRQGDALFQAGWNVCAVGQPGAKSKRPVWPCYDVEHPATALHAAADPPGLTPATAAVSGALARRPLRSVLRQRLPRKLYAVVRTVSYDWPLAAWQVVTAPIYRFKGRAELALRLARGSPGVALQTYWSWASIQELYNVSKDVEADLWVANDWLMLPLAARLASERGGIFVYDTHEFAVNEYMERWKWRLFNRPLVKAIEKNYIGSAKVVSTVSEGIADGLQRVYRLPVRPMVIRNTPWYQTVKLAPVGERIRVLYHGIVAPVRGLEPLIRSVKFWRGEFDLTIRGPGNPEFLDSLKHLIDSEGVADRVHLSPPVPMTALVQEAAAFDVGFFCMPRLSKQHEYVLPNKLFEYIMAGLAICVSDLPEMSRIVRPTGVGVLLPSADETDIAKVINGLTRDAIRSLKARSLEVARELCWEHESTALLTAYAAAAKSK